MNINDLHSYADDTMATAVSMWHALTGGAPKATNIGRDSNGEFFVLPAAADNQPVQVLPTLLEGLEFIANFAVIAIAIFFAFMVLWGVILVAVEVVRTITGTRRGVDEKFFASTPTK